MTPLELVGVPDWAESLLTETGERGIALILFVVAFAPLPSEVVLPLAGFLARAGAVPYLLVFVSSVLGAYLLALVAYMLGRRLGLERGTAVLAKVPLVERADVDRAGQWFDKHGRPSVFLGRFLPGVRSFVGLPAGAARMPLGAFSLLTLAGTALWNGALICLGAALGSQYWLVQRYTRVLNYAVYAATALLIAWLIVRRVRRSHTAARRRKVSQKKLRE